MLLELSPRKSPSPRKSGERERAGARLEICAHHGANAGTHNHRLEFVALWAGRLSCSATNITRYWSLRLQGRQMRLPFEICASPSAFAGTTVSKGAIAPCSPSVRDYSRAVG